MAIPAGTFKTYEQIGIREDLSDVIYDISPVETPFLNSVEHDEAENTLFEWQTDALAAVDTTGALEGDDAPGDASVPTVRLNNRTMIRTRDARVSGTGESVNTAGRANELDYQVLKRGRELRRDMETILLDNTAKAAGAAGSARVTAGVPTWLVTNTVFVTGGTPSGDDPTGDGSDARTDDQTPVAFTEDMLRTVVRLIFDAGGSPDVLMVGAFNRQAVSRFGTEADVRIAMHRMEDSVLHTSFEVYESDFGSLKIVPNRFQRARDAFVFQMDMWAVSFLSGRNMVSFPLAKTGDSEGKQILSEFGLKSKNEAASGGIFDLTSA